MNSEDPLPESILFVTRKWPPAVGGMETYCVRLTNELASRLSLETLALPGRQDGRPPTAISIIGFACRASWRYSRLPRPPSIIHVGDLAAWPLGLLARMRYPRAAVIISAHGTDVSYPRRKGWKGRIYGAYLRLGSKLIRNTTIIANSAATADAAAETGWTGVTIVPLATDFVSGGPIRPHDGQLLFVGRLVERKGCLWFVKNVLPLLPPGMGLKVAGPVWDEAEAAALDDPRVTYLGSLGKEELTEAYRSALCVIVPNIEPASGEFEGFGLVAIEASAVGGLVLAAASGGLVEAVIDGGTGFLLSPENPEAWQSKIMEIANWSDEDRQIFLEGSIQRTGEVYTWQRVANDVVSVYRNTIAAMGRR